MCIALSQSCVSARIVFLTGAACRDDSNAWDGLEAALFDEAPNDRARGTACARLPHMASSQGRCYTEIIQNSLNEGRNRGERPWLNGSL
jgi:hypothetical protein